MIEHEQLKRGDRYLYDFGTSLHEMTVMEVKGDYVRLSASVIGWVSLEEFRTRAKQKIGRTFIFLNMSLWRMK
jgi:hypothetical protein